MKNSMELHTEIQNGISEKQERHWKIALVCRTSTTIQVETIQD
jgi:hypothetical protein